MLISCFSSEPPSFSVFDKQLRKFFKKAAKAKKGKRKLELPSPFQFACLNPATCGTRGGLRMVSLEVPFQMGRLEVTSDAKETLVSTTNVQRLQAGGRHWENPALERIVVDGDSFSASDVTAPASFLCRGRGASPRWELCNTCTDTDSCCNSAERTHRNYGPLRRVFEKPFACVCGTRGSAESYTAYRAYALQLANQWYHVTGGIAEIVNDTEVEGWRHKQNGKGSNLIVLGGPSTNSWAEKHQPLLPGLQLTNSTVIIGPCNWDRTPAVGLLALGPIEGDSLFAMIDGEVRQGAIDGTYEGGFATAFEGRGHSYCRARFERAACCC